MKTTRRQSSTNREIGTSALLLFSLAASAVLIGIAAKTGRYPYVACVGLVPLFAAIRVCRPLGAFFWGAMWGVSLFAVSVAGLGPPIPPTVGSLLLLAGAPAVYAWLGALLTRWIGFSPYVLAVGWMALEATLAPLGLHVGLGDPEQVHEWQLAHWFAQALGYLLVAFAVAYVNALLVEVLGLVPLQFPRYLPVKTSSNGLLLLRSQIVGCLSVVARQPSLPRAPPVC